MSYWTIYFICCVVVLIGIVCINVREYYKNNGLILENYVFIVFALLIVISPITIAACLLFAAFALFFTTMDGIGNLFIKLFELDWWHKEVTFTKKKKDNKDNLDDYTIDAGGLLIKD